ncbi:thioredoxin domain-containing protein [Candidatus Microgenomates bacterium]|nr:thioredoxin domain-containing protein [Candidatus Microgenomates bacterium]
MSKNSEGKSSIFEKFMPMLLIITVGLAFLVGMLWQRVSNLEGGSSGGTKVAGAPAEVNGKLNDAPAEVNGKLTEEQAGKVPGITDADYLLGNRDADVVLIEYSDLECPFCERFHPTGKQAIEEYGDKIAWVYRHFPLETLHPRALPSANAAECVGKEAGSVGFWKFIDIVFSDQTKYLADAGLREAAITSGANGDSFDSCFSSNEFEGKVRDMATKASEAGVTGTPATFVMNKNGDTWLVPGAVPYTSLKTTIDEALGK